MKKWHCDAKVGEILPLMWQLYRPHPLLGVAGSGDVTLVASWVAGMGWSRNYKCSRLLPVNISVLIGTKHFFGVD